MYLVINFFLKLFSLLGLIFISPLLIICSIFIIIEDGFPVIFLQERLGKDLNIFKIFKIRTMKKNSPHVGTHESISSDFLKIGIIIRFFKLDEFPQLVNFMLGTINLVGPRPGLPSQKDLIKYRKERNIYSVKPGITGLSQVLGFDMSNPKLLSIIDEIYIKNRSASLDLLIFFATFLKPLRSKLNNIYNLDEHTTL